jgi:glycosyltransferase involved in cell wall biosynthesis
MKILVLSYEYPPIGGGGGVICKNISENLAIMGNKVTVLTTAFKTKTGNTPDPGTGNKMYNLNVIRLNAKREKAFESNPFEMLSWIATTKRYIKSNPGFVDFDLCMAHFVLPGGEVALWLKINYGLHYVLVSHGHEIPWIHPKQMFFFHLLAYYWLKSVCKHSEVNFIQTRMMKSNIDQFLGEKYEEKNVIISNGADAAQFYLDFSKRREKLRIIFVGRLVIQKDPMTFLRAVRILFVYTNDFEVHILGDGNLRKKMERFVEENGLTGNVRFLGKVAEGKMVEEYQSAHLMVAPSLSEGMSISALEALNCGVYLIATRASGYEDMIREDVNGEFIGYRDTKNLSGKMVDFYKQGRKDKQIPDKHLDDFREAFTWQKITLSYLDLFKYFLR